MLLLSQNLQRFFPLCARRTGGLMLEFCCLELPSCKLPFHYFMEANFTAISAGHSAKSAFLDSTESQLWEDPPVLGWFFFFFFLNWLSHACSFNNQLKFRWCRNSFYSLPLFPLALSYCLFSFSCKLLMTIKSKGLFHWDPNGLLRVDAKLL